jgi:hypothetical protein
MGRVEVPGAGTARSAYQQPIGSNLDNIGVHEKAFVSFVLMASDHP